MKLFKDKESLDYKPDWGSMTLSAKIEYIRDYYKIHIAVVCIVLCIIGYGIRRYVTRTYPVLYVGCFNMTMDENEAAMLQERFLAEEGRGSRDEVVLYNSWYLATDENSPFDREGMTSQMKFLAVTAAQQLDVLLMDQETLDLFTRNGYLADLQELTASDEINEKQKELLAQLSAQFVQTNGAFAIDLTGTDLPEHTDAAGPVYFGISGDTARVGEALSYLKGMLTMS